MGKRRTGRSMFQRVLRVILWLALAGVVCYGALIAYVCYMEDNVPVPAGDYDGVIVLGAQVLPSGEPSVQLRWRLDKAKEAYAAKPCLIVVCGGMAGMEPRPEGEVMREVLISEGIPEQSVISDPRSENTRENLRYAWDILSARGCTKPLVVTSDYHLPRALALMEDMGLEAQGLGSACKPELSFWLKNHMREALAWVKYWGVKYLGLSL